MKSASNLSTTAAVAQTIGSIVIGNAAADNNLSPLGKNVIIGDTARATGGEWTVVIGQNAQTSRGEAVAIGANANVSGYGAVVVGAGGSFAQGDEGIVIGRANSNYAQKSIIIGFGSDNADNSRVKSIVIGSNIKSAQRAIVIGNDCTNYAAADAIQLGNDHIATNSNFAVNIGYGNEIIGYSDNCISIGQNNVIDTLAGAAIIGNGITAVRANTLHTNGLNVGTVNEYADNAAAVAAGLPNGQIYRTGDLLKIVHP